MPVRIWKTSHDTLAEADITSKNPAKVRRQLEGFSRLRERMAQINDADELRNWKNPVNGDELMEHFGLPCRPLDPGHQGSRQGKP